MDEGKPGRLRRVVVVGLCLAAAVAGTVLLARWLRWQAGPLHFMVAMTPYVGLMLLGIAVTAAVCRAWILTVVAATMAVIVGWWWLPPFAGTPEPARSSGVAVMTINMQFGHANPQAVASAVRDHQVDLLAVQELTFDARHGLAVAGLDRELPYRFVSIGNGSSPASGTGIWSRYPLRDKADTDGLVFENLSSTVALPSGSVTFLALHPIPPSPTDGNRGNDVFNDVRTFMDSRPGPAIAAGDFNATRDNAPMLVLVEDGWIDAATAAGAGMVRTWPNDLLAVPPLVALDHVLTRDYSTATQVTIVDVPGTDHRAVIAAL